MRTQSIHLNKGWNAVFLEVQPLDEEPDQLFHGLPLEMVAAYLRPSSPSQFLADPGIDLLKQTGWKVWYPKARVESFLTSLHGIHSHQAYLIKASKAHTWQVSGLASMQSVEWFSDSFNFVGFGVDAQAAPTFAQFFGSSEAHQHNRIYRLINDSWRRVTEPRAEVMRSGEAFWIHCKGSSDYQGPIEIKTPWSAGLVLTSEKVDLELRNVMAHPVTPMVEHVTPGARPVPMSVVIKAVNRHQPRTIKLVPVDSISVPLASGGWSLPLPTLESGNGIVLPLEPALGAMTHYVHTSLLRITTDMGTEAWVPVVALREDLKPRE